MKFKFNKYHFLTFIALFVIEVAIAYYLKSGFIRHTFGDFLVVILLYCFFKSFIKGSAVLIATATLCIAYTIEFLQLTNFLQYLGLEQNKWAALIFGNSFSVQDLVAYTLGIAVTLYVETKKYIRFQLSTHYFYSVHLHNDRPSLVRALLSVLQSFVITIKNKIHN